MSESRGVALVTGAARRIGRAIALRLGSAGFDVAVHFHSSAVDAAETVALLQARGVRAHAFAADLADAAAPARLVAAVEATLGPISVLVNNASIFPRKAFLDCGPEDFDASFAVNLRAPLLLSREVAPGMKARGQGCIVNLGDIHGERPLPGRLPYCVSKAGLHMATLALARELAPEVRVNAVAPGTIVLPEDESPALAEALRRRIPAGRFGTEEEVADAVAFFVEGPAFITGEILRVDGGRHAAW
jgi:pteridine reductase